MLIRIVKMSFADEHVKMFLKNFNSKKEHIRNFEGCEFLELYQEQNNSNIFFTYSYWKSDNHLQNYRQSELFKDVWAKTKPLFNAKPEAWSVEKIASLK